MSGRQRRGRLEDRPGSTHSLADDEPQQILVLSSQSHSLLFVRALSDGIRDHAIDVLTAQIIAMPEQTSSITLNRRCDTEASGMLKRSDLCDGQVFIYGPISSFNACQHL